MTYVNDCSTVQVSGRTAILTRGLEWLNTMGLILQPCWILLETVGGEDKLPVFVALRATPLQNELRMPTDLPWH